MIYDFDISYQQKIVSKETNAKRKSFCQSFRYFHFYYLNFIPRWGNCDSKEEKKNYKRMSKNSSTDGIRSANDKWEIEIKRKWWKWLCLFLADILMLKKNQHSRYVCVVLMYVYVCTHFHLIWVVVRKSFYFNFFLWVIRWKKNNKSKAKRGDRWKKIKMMKTWLFIFNGTVKLSRILHNN